MKKLVSLLCIILTLSSALVGCGSKSESSKTGRTEIALIPATGSIDDKSFNQGAWEGLKEYCDANKVSYKYYKPTDSSETSIQSAIELAIAGGAKVVVCPGFLFSVPLYNLQDKYPDVTFLQLDGQPTSANDEVKIGKNVVSYSYAEEEAGFLAGYAAVKDGYRNLGFMGGMALPAVMRFGYGFVEGAELAAKELGLAKDEVKINYNYTGSFDATPDTQAKAAAWYNNGTEVIFACGGSVGNSVMSAAASTDKKVIGVDVDQSSESPTVITSATKNLRKTVVDFLTAYYGKTLTTGESVVLNATTDSILLPMDTSRFTKFDQAQYDSIYKQLKDGKISLKKDTDVTSAAELPVEYVQVNVIK